jgi:hypothetical protein
MELFSEIYSCYYTVVAKILNTSLNNPITKKNICEIIDSNAFYESAFYIMPKLMEGEWNLLESNDNKYLSKLEGEAKLPLTLLQKSWLKALLFDRRIALFLNQDEVDRLRNYLKDVDPLFNIEDFYYYDSFSDGDNYEDPEYIKNFRRVLEALKNKKVITLTFISEKGRHISGDYLPCKIDYSSKADKFRIYVARIRYGKVVCSAILNMRRIKSVVYSEESFNGNISFDEYIEKHKCTEPVVIEISKERNAVERCMLNFASYEKRTEYDEEADKYISYIYYDKKDETELLIQILSFGPVIKVLGPEVFLKQVKERVKRQAELLGI